MKKEDFEMLFRLYHSAALRLAFMLLKDEEEARDAVSDIFTKVWGGRHSHTERPGSGLFVGLCAQSLSGPA
jgi:RNA polymerase sigma-70 factor (ECF subfamily)